MKRWQEALLAMGLVTPPVNVAGLAYVIVRESVRARRATRTTAAWVMKRMPRTLVRRGVLVSLALLEDPSNRHARCIEVSATPLGDPPRVARGAVKVTNDGLRVAAQVTEPLSRAQVEAAIELVAIAASEDPTIATELAALRDATPLEDSELSPGVELAPDGLRVGVLGGRLVAVLDGVHQFLPRNVRLDAAIEKLRTFVRDGDASPYR